MFDIHEERGKFDRRNLSSFFFVLFRLFCFYISRLSPFFLWGLFLLISVPIRMHQTPYIYSFTAWTSRSQRPCEGSLCSLFLSTLPPRLVVLDVIGNHLGALLRRMLPAQRLDKVALRVHQVKVDAVVDQVVLARLDVCWGAKVHAVRLAHGLDLVVRARQADKARVELHQVLAEHVGRVAGRVTRHKHGQQLAGLLGLDHVKHAAHFVEFFGANVGAVGEAKVDKGVAALEVRFRHSPAVLVDELKGAAHLGPADTLVGLGDALALHALLFVLKVPHQAGAGEDKEYTCFPREGLNG